MDNQRILSSKEYERMDRNGWTMITIEGVFGPKRDEQLQRIHAKYSRIKRYYMTTRIRGYYKTIYACKR